MHEKILDEYFWHYVDRGTLPQDTPLFINPFMAAVIAAEHQLSPEEAAAALENAQKEVME
ncbi:hypothetical protein DB346_23125 [Verrucomicrobia bacterium LW23]|nr:hypothetical protein DB346_23125 [Verrucomicrobia bacterium LW23]